MADDSILYLEIAVGPRDIYSFEMGRPHHWNHFVPQMLLKHWLISKGGRRGVHVYEVERGEARFQTVGRNSRRPFGFAAAPDLYVPHVDGRRALALEAGWLSEQERVLAKVIDQASRRETIAFNRHQELTILKMALFCLEHRSPSELRRLITFIEANPELRAQISSSPERGTKRLILENLIHVVTEMTNRNPFLQFSFLHARDYKFVIGDRPYFRAAELGAFIVLTPSMAIRYSPSENRRNEFGHFDAPPDVVFEFNKAIALQARDWLVALDEKTLVDHTPVFQTEEWQAAWQAPQIEFMSPWASGSGWSITP